LAPQGGLAFSELTEHHLAVADVIILVVIEGFLVLLDIREEYLY